MVKNPRAMRDTLVWSLGWEDPLEEGMATHSSVLENPMHRGAWRAAAHGVAESDLTERLSPAPRKPQNLTSVPRGEAQQGQSTQKYIHTIRKQIF